MTYLEEVLHAIAKLKALKVSLDDLLNEHAISRYAHTQGRMKLDQSILGLIDARDSILNAQTITGANAITLEEQGNKEVSWGL